MALRLSTELTNRLMGLNTNVTGCPSGTFAASMTWTNTLGATWVNAAGAAGSTGYALLTSTGTAAEMRSGALTTTTNTQYDIDFWIRKVTSGVTEGAVKVGTSAGGTEILVLTTILPTTADAWVKRRVSFNSGANTTVHVTFMCVNVTNAHYFHLDEVTISKASACFQDIFTHGVMEIWSGPQPTLPDNAPTGALLCTIYSDGAAAGLLFDDAVAGVLSKAVLQTWSGTAGGTGTAGYFRLKTAQDTGNNVTTDSRMDGSIATSGGELNMSSTTITAGAVQTISTFTVTMPAQ